jgi:hypothetical protein
LLLCGHPNGRTSFVDDGLGIHFMKYYPYCVIMWSREIAIPFHEMDANVVHFAKRTIMRYECDMYKNVSDFQMKMLLLLLLIFFFTEHHGIDLKFLSIFFNYFVSRLYSTSWLNIGIWFMKTISDGLFKSYYI